jgi:hypothetical protein
MVVWSSCQLMEPATGFPVSSSLCRDVLIGWVDSPPSERSIWWLFDDQIPERIQAWTGAVTQGPKSLHIQVRLPPPARTRCSLRTLWRWGAIGYQSWPMPRPCRSPGRSSFPISREPVDGVAGEGQLHSAVRALSRAWRNPAPWQPLELYCSSGCPRIGWRTIGERRNWVDSAAIGEPSPVRRRVEERCPSRSPGLSATYDASR